MSKYIGDVSAYAYAVSKGYTGTEEEFAELMASYADVGQTAVDAKDAAVAAKTAAQTAATTATNKASEATTAAQTATTKAGEAQTSAQTASTKASEASQSASTASTKASESAQSATNAQGYANTAESAKTASQTAQGLAESARDLAQGYAEDAQGYAEDAQASAEGISASAIQIAQNTANILKAFPTDTASGAVASFSDGADNISLKSLIVNIDPVQDTSSGDPSPENICPISGWTGCEVDATGYNVWDEEWESGGLSYGNSAENSSRIRSKNYIVCKPNTTYYFNRGANNGNMWVSFYDRNKVCLNPTINGNNIGNSAVTTPDKCYYIRFFLSAQTEYQHDVAINYPSTDHDYHPYVGQTIPINWQTEAGTVYGCKLDVLSGVLTVDKASFKVSDVAWTRYSTEGNYKFYHRPSNIKPGENIRVGGSISSAYPIVAFNDLINTPNAFSDSANSTGRISVYDSEYASSTAEEFVAGRADVRFVYPLATPIEIQLTPHEVNSLFGQNNIFADTGDSAVEYRADTRLYIEKLTQPEEDDMIADSAITSGQFFMIGNSLYRALTNIASGATITVGTNAQRVSLSDALNLVNS